MQDKHMRYYLLMTFGTLLWAGAFIAGKLGVGKLSPVLLTFFRMFFATVIIFPIMIHKERENWKIKKENIKYVVYTGLVGMIGYHVLFFTALKYTTVTNSSMINATNPIITSILAAIILKDKFPLNKVIFIVTAFIGVTSTIVDWDFSRIVNMSFNQGDVIMITATTCWAAYSIIVKSVMKYFTPIKLTAYSFLSSSLMIAPFAIYEMLTTDMSQIGLMPFVAVLYMAIFPTVIGYTIQQIVIKELGPSKTALFINLVPIFSVLLATVMLGETFNYMNIFSGIIIIGSVFMVLRKPKQLSLLDKKV